MNQNKSPKKTILIIVGVIVLLGLFFYLYSSRSTNVETTLVPGAVGMTDTLSTDVAGSIEIVRLILELERVSFSKEPLESPALQALKDWSVTLSKEDPGRADPFAEIGVGGPPRERVSRTSTTTSREVATTTEEVTE